MQDVKFKDHKTVLQNPARYETVMVDVAAVLKSWRVSMFSFEWLDKNGAIKAKIDLPKKEQAKRQEAEDAIANGVALEMPVMGIGLTDNIEIGAGRPIFLTVAAHGVKTVPVHIPASNKDEFKKFIAP